MVPCFLDFHENIRFWKTLIQYQEQPYPIEKTNIVFLDPPKKAWNICSIFMEQSGSVPVFNIPGTLFRECSYIQYSRNIISENSPEFHWEFSSNVLEYTGNISRERSRNIPQAYVCPVGIFATTIEYQKEWGYQKVVIMSSKKHLKEIDSG